MKMNDHNNDHSQNGKSNNLMESLFKVAKTIPTIPIPGREKYSPIPLSFAQERLWFLDQLNPGNPAYNICRAFRITGPLDISILKTCVDKIIRRHEALRTSIQVINGEPFQIIHNDIQKPLKYMDLTKNPNCTQGEQIKHILKTEAKKPFDLSKIPLFRIIVLKTENRCFKFLLVIHHIISDGWSMTIFMNELTALYNAYRKGEAINLPKPDIQYGDYAVWQKSWFNGKTREDLIAFWKNELNNYSVMLNLPTDRARPAQQIISGSILPIQISKKMMDSIKSFCHREDVTLFMMFFAAFNTLLYRYAGDEDIMTGTPIANRNQPGINALFGFFVNTLALRTNLSGRPSFRELLGRVRHTSLKAYANQEMPFEKLVQVIHPERNLSQNPIFQVMFTFQNMPKPNLQFADLVFTAESVHNDTSKFDLSLTCAEDSEGLTGSLEFNTDIFDKRTAGRMLDHYRILLQAILENPDQRIHRLPILSRAEKQKIMVDWNKKQVTYPENLGIHHLFERQVELFPDKTAVVFEDKQITYIELNNRANQLAHHLIDLGVETETLVGVYLEPSIEAVVGIIGILKAGGAYVPLNPDDPVDRQAMILEDARVHLLLTKGRTPLQFQDQNVPMVDMTNDWSNIALQNDYNPGRDIQPSDLMYIIYTSGSTGRPKGVMITHKNIVALLHTHKHVTRERNPRIGTSVSPLSFDVSVEECWSCLSFGGTLHIIRHELVIDGDYFANYIVKHKITATYIYPQLIPEICRYLSRVKDRLELKCVLTGLQPKTEGTMQHLRDLSDELRILNVYGPTETTYGATFFNFQKSRNSHRDVPIGIPYPNYQTFIVDSFLQPVPIGVQGEILIGGTGLARGYLNQPDLTDKKFIPNLFSDQPGSRLYRTGDLGRFLPDGNIEFLGRLDNQVKIRGYRIELGEIESVLEQHPHIREAVVSTKSDSTGEERLVAYCVLSHGHTTDTQEIKDFTKLKLPVYMVPPAIVILDAMPRTTSQKIDRSRLPEPDRNHPDPNKTYFAPQTPVEEVVVHIWSEVLGIEQIGTHDNFFDLGGDSLLAIRVTSRIRDTFSHEISARHFFENPTITEYASFLLHDPENREKMNRIAQHLIKIIRMPDKDVEHALKMNQNNDKIKSK